MHTEAFEWVARWSTPKHVTVLDIGGRNVNGSCRDLFPGATYTALDIADGPGVDIVADAADWQPPKQWDIVLSTEVLEHTAQWPGILATAYRACKDGGSLIVTAAGPGRRRHSAIDGGEIREGEWYENIEPDLLEAVLVEIGWRVEMLDVGGLEGFDVRAFCVKEPT